MEGQVLTVLMGAHGDITVDPNETLEEGGHNILRIEGSEGGVALRRNIWAGPERTVVGVRYSKRGGGLKRISMTRKHEDARYARTRTFVDGRFSPDEPFEGSFRTQLDKRPVHGQLFTPAPNQGPMRDLALREVGATRSSIMTIFENLPIHVSPQEIIAFVRRYCDRILPHSIVIPFSDLGFEGLRIQAELAAREAEKP